MKLIQTQQHWFPRLLNIAATLLAWGVLAYLMVDGVNTLLQGGPRPTTLSLPGQFFATRHSLLWYLVMAVVLSAALLGWAKYNQRRAARYSRRKRAPNISNAQLAASFGVNEDVLQRMQQEQVLVLFNAANGKLSEVSLVRQGQQRIDVRTSKASHTKEEPLAA
ncbi:poly-beta-1,6-N-acetyl-D-glucosamine biosynthesis protein PgaD [Marinobacterium weihaiense]|uniref:Poly-beta-1,6-N-acetyl-D-glucosamine biosynthesis protein PgaD n=1 Tax=Marinobacterium weihaiense TaxID=2851016 RepID=A0ABS6MDB7_9GAMM|nr:poly-beta-1,6-N-acetyl-D-glucosamine biosynthesis protein PgaD [Marinobacterium weihaiense]MBV0934283.1 poly-beta-1,6-N-acetyl-D-glucosamine biosynthesis protein PgaD [Marinobacterium weihaiense]